MSKLPDIYEQLVDAMEYWYDFANTMPKEMFIDDKWSNPQYELAKELFDKWLHTQSFKAKLEYKKREKVKTLLVS